MIEGDFVPGAVETTLKLVEGYDVSPFPTINDAPSSVVGGGDIMTMFNDTPAARAFMEFLATPEAAQAWAELAASRPREQARHERLSGRDLEEDRERDRRGRRVPLRPLRPPARGVRRHRGPGALEASADFLKNPNDVDGIAQQMEAAAKKAYG